MRALILFLIFFLNSNPRAFSQEALKKVCIKDACVLAEIADNADARRLGLMFREDLPEGRGMLFVFKTEGRYGFWMKNMKFPIDIIWIDKEKKVVDIKPNLSACREACEIFEPGAKALYVLEVEAGFSRRNKIAIGDKISIDGY